MFAEKKKRKTHMTFWAEEWQYKRIHEEIESGASETEGEVIRKCLRERFKPPEGAW